jgi:hypothetical protein
MISFCVGGVTHIVGNILTRATTLLQTTLKSESAKKIMGFQSYEGPNFGTLNWESRDKMTFGCWPRGQA